MNFEIDEKLIALMIATFGAENQKSQSLGDLATLQRSICKDIAHGTYKHVISSNIASALLAIRKLQKIYKISDGDVQKEIDDLHEITVVDELGLI